MQVVTYLLDGSVGFPHEAGAKGAQYLGHADPGFSLRFHSHLMPDMEDLAARTAIDAAHARADSVRTATGVEA